MRVLAIDYGRKRTGLAVTDPLQIIAGALDTVATADLENYVLQYVKREQVERIIVGHPRQMNGEDSENMSHIVPFVDRLRELLPNMPIELWDERFTSVIAHQTMIDAGLRKKARQSKPLVDKIAATIILQSWMESHR